MRFFNSFVYILSLHNVGSVLPLQDDLYSPPVLYIASIFPTSVHRTLFWTSPLTPWTCWAFTPPPPTCPSPCIYIALSLSLDFVKLPCLFMTSRQVHHWKRKSDKVLEKEIFCIERLSRLKHAPDQVANQGDDGEDGQAAN